jgi:hypothetical protein
MSYRLKVKDAQVVSRNEKNGLFEVLAVLEDRTQCRLVFETLENGETRATHISRLHREPCPICKRDYICKCVERFRDEIADQADAFINAK